MNRLETLYQNCDYGTGFKKIAAVTTLALLFVLVIGALIGTFVGIIHLLAWVVMTFGILVLLVPLFVGLLALAWYGSSK